MIVVTNMHKPYFILITCHDYEGVMSVLNTPSSKVLPTSVNLNYNFL